MARGGRGGVGRSTRARIALLSARYLRGVGIALVGGFWAGALVTGPAIRLVMRLLAVTAGEDAQGRLTEAEEVVGEIDLGGTLGLIMFGGIFAGLASAVTYVLVRRWLPRGRLGGVVFGVLHLVIAATVLDPLRPDNRDFDLVGPGWLAVTTFGLACIVHGMAVVAFADRYSQILTPRAIQGRWTVAAVAPLVLPVVLAAVVFVTLIGIAVGLVVAEGVSRHDRVGRWLRSRKALIAGRLAIAALALALLPRTITDLHDVVNRDEHARPDQATSAEG